MSTHTFRVGVHPKTKEGRTFVSIIFTEAEMLVRTHFRAFVSEWRMFPEERLKACGASTNWLLYTDAKNLKKLGIDRYQKRFSDTENHCLIPLFQLEVDTEGNLVPTVVVQNVNRMLRKTRTLHEIAIWWLAPHDLLSEFPDSNGQVRQSVSPRMALLDARLSECLIGAANRTIARDVTVMVERVRRAALA